MNCQLCEGKLDSYEMDSPRVVGGWTMCDECFTLDYSYMCGVCEVSVPNDRPTLATAIGSRATEVGLNPGIYQIVRWPWLESDMLSHRVFSGSLLRVADAHQGSEDGGVQLCPECTIRAIVRRTRSGRWRVTTTYSDGFGWHTKTWIYRTKALATRRATAYVESEGEA